jgi:hypothetical protein
MNHSKGPWSYDEESGEVTTKDRAGYWGPSHCPVIVCTVESLDGIDNGPLIAAAPEMLDALKDAYPYVRDDALRARIGSLICKASDPVPRWQSLEDAYDATDRTAIHTDCASEPK